MKLRIIIFISAFFMIGITSLNMPQAVMASEKKIAENDLKMILEKLDELTRRIEALEKKEKPAEKAKDVQEDVETLKKDVREMSDYMDEIATRTLVDKISLGAELRTRSDWFRFKNNDAQVKDHIDAVVSNRFRLNLRSDIFDNLKFHGRLTVYKNWMVGRGTPAGDSADLNESRIPTDATVKLERAYVDYFPEKLPVALTFGRIPVTDGLPTDLREDTPRKSTYPSLAYDVTGDGVALTFFLDDIIPFPDPNWKFIYTRLNLVDDMYVYRDDPAEVDESTIFITQLETRLPGLLEDTLLIANFFYLGDYPAPNLSYRGIYDDIIPSSLGSFNRWTFLAESKNFLNSGIDWFASYSYLETDVKGDPALYKTQIYLDDGTPVWVPVTMGLLSEDNQDDKTGYAWYVGARIKIPFKLINEPMIGAEYNYGSENWFGLTSGSEDPLHKLDTRGSAWDFYYIQPITKNFYLRGGYTLIEYKYSGSGNPIGSPVETDQQISNTYILLDAKF